RTANQFDEAGVRLGYGAAHSTWLWRHFGVIGFALIALAFLLELIAVFIPHCPHKPASEKTDGKDVSKREAGANEPPDKPS
ncbi:MAG: hypothetical protein WAO21_12605, partial [Verrucomicrobiia bacterium]